MYVCVHVFAGFLSAKVRAELFRVMTENVSASMWQRAVFKGEIYSCFDVREQGGKFFVAAAALTRCRWN